MSSLSPPSVKVCELDLEAPCCPYFVTGTVGEFRHLWDSGAPLWLQVCPLPMETDAFGQLGMGEGVSGDREGHNSSWGALQALSGTSVVGG